MLQLCHAYRPIRSGDATHNLIHDDVVFSPRRWEIGPARMWEGFDFFGTALPLY